MMMSGLGTLRWGKRGIPLQEDSVSCSCVLDTFLSGDHYYVEALGTKDAPSMTHLLPE